MFRPATLLRLQRILMGAVFLAALLCYLVMRPLAQRLADSTLSLNSLWDQLVDINLRNKTRLGLDSADMTESFVATEKSLQAVQQAARQSLERLAFEPELQAKTRETFQFFEFDQTRQQMLGDLRRLAQSKNVVLDPSAVAGFPEYLPGRERPALLWAQLATVNHLLTTAVAAGPTVIKSASLLPMIDYPPAGDDRRRLSEMPIRLELVGRVEAILVLLRTLPLRSEEAKELELPPLSINKPALFIHKLLLRCLPEDPSQVFLDAIVSGFLLSGAAEETGPFRSGS